MTSDPIAVGNEQIVTFSLVELLTQMVFVAMALALVLQNETLKKFDKPAEAIRRLEAEAKTLRRQIADRDATIVALREAIADKDREIARLEGLPADRLPSTAGTWISRDLYDRMALQTRFNAELRREDAVLRQRLGQKTGHFEPPKCQVTPGVLATIRLLPSGGFAMAPAWAPGAASQVAGVNGATTFAATTARDGRGFARLARPVADWGMRQPQPCRFTVTAVRGHNDASLYVRQLGVIEQYFRARRAG